MMELKYNKIRTFRYTHLRRDTTGVQYTQGGGYYEQGKN